MSQGVLPADPELRDDLLDVLMVESHPGWTYVAGGLADQPQHLLDLERALASAREWARTTREAELPESE